MCDECHDTGRTLVVSQDPATGEWTHVIEARCGACPAEKRTAPDESIEFNDEGSTFAWAILDTV